VDKTSDIPIDYKGAMGVPITFLDKYNPEQFEILGIAGGSTRASAPKEFLNEVSYIPHPKDKGGSPILDGIPKYVRIIIRYKKPKS